MKRGCVPEIIMEIHIISHNISGFVFMVTKQRDQRLFNILRRVVILPMGWRFRYFSVEMG